MIPREQEQSYRDIQVPHINKGMILEDVMSYHSAPADSATWLENVDNDSAGILTTRRPFRLQIPFVGHVTSPSKVVQVNNLTNSDKSLVYWQEGRNLQQQNLISSSSLTTYSNFFASASYKNRYDFLQGNLILTNAGAGSTIYYQTGNTSTPTALNTKFDNIAIDLVCAGFNGRIWGTGTTLSIPNLYYTDVIPTTGVTNLTTASQQFLGLNLGTENPTALVQTAQILFVFSMNKILRVWGINTLDNFSISNVGTVSQESVMRTPYGIFFYHPSGIYQMSETGAVKCISDAVYYLLKLVAPANQKNVLCWNRDQFHYFYLGNLTGYDTNKFYYLKYNSVNNAWSVGSTKTAILAATSGYLTTFGATETTTTTSWYPDTVVMTASVLATQDVVDPLTDNQALYGDFNNSSSASPNIDIDIQTRWLTFSDLAPASLAEARYKRVNGLAIPHTNAQGLIVSVQMDSWDKDRWDPVGQLDENPVTLFREYQSDGFNRCKFRYSGTSQGARVKVGMPIVLQLDDMGYIHQ